MFLFVIIAFHASSSKFNKKILTVGLSVVSLSEKNSSVSAPNVLEAAPLLAQATADQLTQMFGASPSFATPSSSTGSIRIPFTDITLDGLGEKINEAAAQAFRPFGDITTYNGTLAGASIVGTPIAKVGAQITWEIQVTVNGHALPTFKTKFSGQLSDKQLGNDGLGKAKPLKEQIVALVVQEKNAVAQLRNSSNPLDNWYVTKIPLTDKTLRDVAGEIGNIPIPGVNITPKQAGQLVQTVQQQVTQVASPASKPSFDVPFLPPVSESERLPQWSSPYQLQAPSNSPQPTGYSKQFLQNINRPVSVLSIEERYQIAAESAAKQLPEALQQTFREKLSAQSLLLQGGLFAGFSKLPPAAKGYVGVAFMGAGLIGKAWDYGSIRDELGSATNLTQIQAVGPKIAQYVANLTGDAALMAATAGAFRLMQPAPTQPPVRLKVAGAPTDPPITGTIEIQPLKPPVVYVAAAKALPQNIELYPTPPKLNAQKPAPGILADSNVKTIDVTPTSVEVVNPTLALRSTKMNNPRLPNLEPKNLLVVPPKQPAQPKIQGNDNTAPQLGNGKLLPPSGGPNNTPPLVNGAQTPFSIQAQPTTMPVIGSGQSTPTIPPAIGSKPLITTAVTTATNLPVYTPYQGFKGAAPPATTSAGGITNMPNQTTNTPQAAPSTAAKAGNGDGAQTKFVESPQTPASPFVPHFDAPLVPVDQTPRSTPPSPIPSVSKPPPDSANSAASFTRPGASATGFTAPELSPNATLPQLQAAVEGLGTLTEWADFVIAHPWLKNDSESMKVLQQKYDALQQQAGQPRNPAMTMNAENEQITSMPDQMPATFRLPNADSPTESTLISTDINNIKGFFPYSIGELFLFWNPISLEIKYFLDSKNSPAAHIKCTGEGYEFDGFIAKNAKGRDYLYIDGFKVTSEPLKGNGTKLIKGLIQQSHQLGLEEIRLYAAGSPTNNLDFSGWYFWPRLGFDAPLSMSERSALREFSKNLNNTSKNATSLSISTGLETEWPRSFYRLTPELIETLKPLAETISKAESVQDLMQEPATRELWRQLGRRRDMVLKLRGASAGTSAAGLTAPSLPPIATPAE